MPTKTFTKDLSHYQRFLTRNVSLNHFDIGGNNYIRLQSMTNTDTRDINASVEQASRIIEQGADLVRFTTPTIKDVEALEAIRRKLRVLYDVPLVADIHFSPKVAMAALEVADKIRVNPGNLVDRAKGIEYDNEKYQQELKKIEKTFAPILEHAKYNKRAIRIGTNIGSLSERILQKYGATAQGMVKATMEYIELARKYEFHDIVISLKASSPKVNVWANRLLVSEFMDKGYDYPIHLGVTEAGNGLEGRIKSAVGIGALLVDGIGDTVRVSLTEAPENEIPVARKIVNYATARGNDPELETLEELFFEAYNYKPRKIKTKLDFNQPIVVVDVFDGFIEFDDLVKPDFIITEKSSFVENKDTQVVLRGTEVGELVLLDTDKYLKRRDGKTFVLLHLDDLNNRSLVKKLSRDEQVVIVFEPNNKDKIGETRVFFKRLIDRGINAPVVLKFTYDDNDLEDFAIKASVDSSVFFIDGLANGLWLSSQYLKASDISEVAYNILQAAGARVFKAEIVSCPSCGRATFDVEQVANKVKERLGHLKGVKIAVMGCIVNGLGEMADADYGYVGTGKGLVSLYKGVKLVEKNLSQEEALDRLEILIENDK